MELDRDLADALACRLAGTNVQVIEADATALDFPDRRFTGATSFNMLHHVPSDDAQDRIFAELGRVLRAGGVFAAADSAASEDPSGFHEGDTYHPIDPDRLGARLEAAGFTAIDVGAYELGWICSARIPG